MAAYFESGFSVREPMWHGQGLVLDDYPESWLDAREKAGLTWEPEERTAWIKRRVDEFVLCRHCNVQLGHDHADDCPLADVLRDVKADDVLPLNAVHVVGSETIFVPVPGHKLIVRNDTRDVLGVTSGEFASIYHGEDYAEEHAGASMEEIIDAFTGVDGKVKFETAGSIQGGRGVWVLLYLDEPYELPGDDTQVLPFAAVLNRHDGTGACKLIKTQVRVVCWNTWQMALTGAEAAGLVFSFRHVGDVKDRIDEAKAAIAGLRSERDDYIAMADELTKLNVDDNKVAAFLTEFLPSPRENGQVCSDRVHSNVEKARELFKHLYFDSVTNEALRGTGMGLLNASTEYLDHARAFRTRDSYLGRSVLRAEPAKAKALQLVRAL